MPTDSAEIERLASGLFQEVLRRTHLSAAPDLSTLLAEEARRIGADPTVLYLVDHEQRLLVPVPGPGTEGRETLPIQGTVPGRVFASTSIMDLEGEPSGRRLWLPLVDGTERLGAMEMAFAAHAEPLPEALVAVCERFAHLSATLVTNKDLYSDYFKRLRRQETMTVASELMGDLVPPHVFATDDFVLAAMLEPSYDNGGDAYDYAINEDGVLHLAVFDAMGHGLAATGVAAFGLAAYRSSRRRGATPGGMYRDIDAAVFEQYPSSRFVTGLIAQLEIESGRLRWISAGHPPPLLLRDGRLVKTLAVEPSPPMGMRLSDEPPAEAEEWLEPGDMVLLYTDGLTEARRPGGDLFTVERLASFIERQAADGLPAPETLRGLREAIIERGAGALYDDATALLLEWRRGTQEQLLPQTV
jgi:serine phosphatase RsbU (regulator of sigma subunit)